MAPMILVVGDASWDLFCEIDRFPGPDEKVFTNSMFTGVGGVGVNAAIAARLLGVDTSFMGRFGGDAFAALVRDRLADAHLDLSLCRIDPDVTTPIAIILSDPTGEKRIVLAPSEGMSPTADQFPDPPPGDIDWMHMVAYDIDAAVAIASVAGDIPISLDLEPATVPGGEPVAMRSLVGLLDTVIVNEHACRLFGGLEPAVATLRDWGASVVVVTLGAGGALCVDGSVRSRILAPDVKVIDTTGAGDTFAAAYAVSRSEGSTPFVAAGFAVAAATLSCRGLGPRGAFPTRSQIAAVQEV